MYNGRKFLFCSCLHVLHKDRDASRVMRIKLRRDHSAQAFNPLASWMADAAAFAERAAAAFTGSLVGRFVFPERACHCICEAAGATLIPVLEQQSERC